MAQARSEPYGSLVVERYRKSPLVQSLMSDALSALRQAHPGYTVARRAFKPGDTAAGAVLRGDLDVGVMACTTDRTPRCPVSAADGFGVLELTAWRERICFVLRRENLLARRVGLTLEDLRDCCFVFPLNPEFGRCQPDVALLFAQRGLTLRSRPHELNDVEELGLAYDLRMDLG